jgi:hypothetical protein
MMPAAQGFVQRVGASEVDARRATLLDRLNHQRSSNMAVSSGCCDQLGAAASVGDHRRLEHELVSGDGDKPLLHITDPVGKEPNVDGALDNGRASRRW